MTVGAHHLDYVLLQQTLTPHSASHHLTSPLTVSHRLDSRLSPPHSDSPPHGCLSSPRVSRPRTAAHGHARRASVRLRPPLTLSASRLHSRLCLSLSSLTLSASVRLSLSLPHARLRLRLSLSRLCLSLPSPDSRDLSSLVPVETRRIHQVLVHKDVTPIPTDSHDSRSILSGTGLCLSLASPNSHGLSSRLGWEWECLKLIRNEHKKNMGIIEKIKEIVAKMARTQKNKATGMPKADKKWYAAPTDSSNYISAKSQGKQSLGVEWKVSKHKLLEVERKLKQLNKTPVKSIQTTYLTTLGYNYIGASNVWNRRVEADDEFSTARIWLMNGPLESFDSVKAGGMDDASQRTWCFNLVCAGFVQTSHEVAFGATMEATSS
ncbi:hypothetical protein Syun_003898 [Stephania yunnanensis]|uniref:Neprosin PEP catalytic domain-containing protein n=1 Tax=Stephania yunnanensis TaxID=152371 RepID=A0AAP0L232_9MAGN